MSQEQRVAVTLVSQEQQNGRNSIVTGTESVSDTGVRGTAEWQELCSVTGTESVSDTGVTGTVEWEYLCQRFATMPGA